MLLCNSRSTFMRLVLCLLNGWCFAARVFRSRRGASDEHIPKWICKEGATKPGAKRTAALWVAPSLACGFVARRSQPHCGGCSLLASRHRPNWAQQNTSHLGDTTLASSSFSPLPPVEPAFLVVIAFSSGRNDF